jgi:hypothetical protein
MMTRFIEVFRELGRATELLKTQVNLILVERLQQNWTKVSGALGSHHRLICPPAKTVISATPKQWAGSSSCRRYPDGLVSHWCF